MLGLRWRPGLPASRGPERQTIADAIDRSSRRVEDLRLRASPQGYEELYALLGEILDPLDALAEVGHRVEG